MTIGVQQKQPVVFPHRLFRLHFNRYEYFSVLQGLLDHGQFRRDPAVHTTSQIANAGVTKEL